MQFYILMIDYGKRPSNGIGPYGLEAVSNPEHTRRQIVSEVRDILASDDKSVAFVKEVDGNYIFDITADIISEAEAERGFVAQAMSDPLAAQFDHRRDELKHGERV